LDDRSFDQTAEAKTQTDGVTREEDWHGQNLSDAHKSFASLYDAGDDQRERGEQTRAQRNQDRDGALLQGWW